jgi:thiol peroxidase
MEEHPNAVTMKGSMLTLLGTQVTVGSKAPSFRCVGKDLGIVTLEATAGKPRILCAVPSLDTGVCSTEMKKFDEEAKALGERVGVYVISMDLPFAQNRWCLAESASNITSLSDHLEASFGTAYGLLIKELRLLARAVIVLDKDNIVRHYELVKEIATEPDYAAAVAAAKACS